MLMQRRNFAVGAHSERDVYPRAVPSSLTLPNMFCQDSKSPSVLCRNESQCNVNRKCCPYVGHLTTLCLFLCVSYLYGRCVQCAQIQVGVYLYIPGCVSAESFFIPRGLMLWAGNQCPEIALFCFSSACLCVTSAFFLTHQFIYSNRSEIRKSGENQKLRCNTETKGFQGDILLLLFKKK